MKPKKTQRQGTGSALVTVTLALAMLLASLGTSIANIALPSLAEAFSAPFAKIQAVVVVYLVTLMIGALVAGRLGDRFGLKPALVGGLIVFALASVACALATDLTWLICARGFQGVGAAFLMTLSMALMRQTAGKERIGQAMGLLGTVSAIGTALGPSLGGLLIPAMGWHSIFWIQVPVAVAAVILTVILLPNEKRGVKPKAASFLSVLDHGLVSSLAINLLVAAVMMTTLVVGPFYLGFGLGLTPTQVGLVMTIGPAISIVSGVPSGRLVDLWGSSKILMIGLVLLCSGSLLLAFIPGWIGIAGYVISTGVLTVGYQLFQAANNTTVLADAPASARGTISGVLSLSRNLGLIGGASVMGAVFAFGVGTREISEANPTEIADGMQYTFLFAGLLIAMAIVLNTIRKGFEHDGYQ
ncbi:MFS transporter [Brucella rhizosphaerae]|uniref:Transmembrane secretion effector family protein n=1 Tax=Brucella rhizosphaerae TaxID=571254 RepID=A0A256FTJ0_9HYPH|nr:MFS transporter [Brucella rhizosphaerae]OYR18195.1 transmembrane secretion effector family protein [Brucella rhizosphaerae]